jgi:hypothetical protein
VYHESMKPQKPVNMFTCAAPKAPAKMQPKPKASKKGK